MGWEVELMSSHTLTCLINPRCTDCLCFLTDPALCLYLGAVSKVEETQIEALLDH